MQPVEIAQAAVMAALCAATAIISVVVPFAGGLALLGTVPMGLLAYRYRPRVLITGAVAAATIAFLIAGMGGFMTVVNCAYIGGLTGVIKRHRRGLPTVIVASALAGGVFGAGVVAALSVLSRLRHLIFDAITANVNGVAAAMAKVPLPQFQRSAEDLTGFLGALLRHWQWLILAQTTVSLIMVSLIGWAALSRVLDRLRGVPDVHKLDVAFETGPVAPVPIELEQVRFRYPQTDHDALGPVTMQVLPGEHLAVTGANGSGKTTLMLMLAGRAPTGGIIKRPGAVGLGAPGGTAVVMQHPESQVLGTRVADDVVWGLPSGATTDIDRLLDEVGLAGFAERDTGGLSGGELQRLAVAAALAREPALLIADEVTSMIDPQGREVLLKVLAGLSGRHRTSLVHITHYDDEVAGADRVVDLSGSAENTATVRTADVPVAAIGAGPSPSARPVLELSGVGYEYASGTPWANTALREVSLAVGEGDGVLIHGGNGSGKSTLAWIMAGLTTPTTGQCLLDGRPADEQVGAVALSFQAARLQLMRSHVGVEVASAAGFSPRDYARVYAALAAVGLDATMASRRIDQLSGGQMRRLVLAGLLARSPRALILDEPLAGLDAASRHGLLRLLEDLRRNTGLPVVVISHDFAGLERLCPRTLHLRNGELVAAAAGAA